MRLNATLYISRSRELFLIYAREHEELYAMVLFHFLLQDSFYRFQENGVQVRRGANAVWTVYANEHKIIKIRCV